jgi:superfamily II DNA or RNA helicase
VLADDLAEALRVHPDSTAGELVELVTYAGSMLDEKVVARTLYAAHGRFRCDGGDPVRWCLAGPADTRPPPTVRLVTVDGTGDDPVAPTLYRWQRAALAAWVRQRRRGVIEAVTGAGKTIVGVAAVLEQRRARGQAVVLVPTKELQQQWLAVLGRWCGPATLVGARGAGGRATLVSHDVVVALVNSVRESDLRPTRPGGLLVADECHRYGSEMNRLALDARMTRRLGLSATYVREDDGHRNWLDPYFGGTCFTLGYQEAVADGVVAEPVVVLLGVALHADERARYDEHTETIGQAAARLIEQYGVTSHPYSAFMREVNQLAGRFNDGVASNLARRYRHAVLDRRRLLAHAREKDERLGGLAPAVAAAARTIVFTQSIAASESAAALLRARGVTARAVHSGLPSELRRASLQQFATGEVHALTAPRVLDEGIDVPAADLAVIIGASRTRRQMIQRMGRVLRVKTGGGRARFAILYAEQTVEDPARGAHEGFLGEVTSIATALRTFPSSTPADAVNAFLDGAARTGALPA